MTSRQEGRLLFLSVSAKNEVLGYVVSPQSDITMEFLALQNLKYYGIFQVMEAIANISTREALINELGRIHHSEWMNSKRLDREGNVLPCNAPNCGVYTLEAELGITPNGYAEPDFLGWEVKQFHVSNFNNLNSSTITLMTPGPTGGLYVFNGVDFFIRTYGYHDANITDRINFGGIHKTSERNPRTNLTLELIGFDKELGRIRSTSGRIALIDINDVEVASWDFSSMLKHWNRKHNQACYVPSLSEQSQSGRRYKFGNNIIMGTGTDFQLFLMQIATSNIYYDPGIKMENSSSVRPQIKRRSQFRIKSRYLHTLYKENEIVDVTE